MSGPQAPDLFDDLLPDRAGGGAPARSCLTFADLQRAITEQIDQRACHDLDFGGERSRIAGARSAFIHHSDRSSSATQREKATEIRSVLGLGYKPGAALSSRRAGRVAGAPTL
ncbi:MAG TPA: hypothetical protein VKQ09_09815 [Sphingomonas sp.]|nr:hypothetical protein [Sphingomonas sp.]